jgi:hypothetical protein
MLVLLRKTLQGKFDLYDFVILSMVAIIPAAFALFPTLAYLLSHLTGVVFPFVVMFGALFLVVFAFMHNITQRLHKLERQNWTLIQEQSLLELELKAREGEHARRMTRPPSSPRRDRRPAVQNLGDAQPRTFRGPLG